MIPKHAETASAFKPDLRSARIEAGGGSGAGNGKEGTAGTRARATKAIAVILLDTKARLIWIEF
jgi:hypothetical protein